MILITGPVSRFGHLCHSGLCVVLVPGSPVGLGGPHPGLGSQGAWGLRGLCFRCVLLCPGLPLFAAGTGMRDGKGGGWSFIFLFACVFDTVPRRGSHFPEPPLLCVAPPALPGFTAASGKRRSRECSVLPAPRTAGRLPDPGREPCMEPLCAWAWPRRLRVSPAGCSRQNLAPCL